MNIRKTILSGSIALLALAAGVQAAPLPANITEVTGTISVDTRWTRDRVYVLREVIYVLPPAKLIIEPGTIIRGVKEGSGADTTAATSPGALIAARGSKIIANGTPDEPIVFTSVDDPNVIGGAATVPTHLTSTAGVDQGFLVVPKVYDPAGATSANGFAYDAEWGGLVLLGEAPIGFDADGDGAKLMYTPGTNTYAGDTLHYPTGAASPLSATHDIKGGDGVGVAVIEGAAISLVAAPAYVEPFPGADNEPAPGTIIPAVYGGLDRASNSGSLQFVESRYGGFVIGSANELNGITFGATGTATTCEWLSSYNNADDGFEFFGGYNYFRYLFSLFQGDDGLDGDQGFNGAMQKLFVIMDNQSIARNGLGGWPATLTGRVVANIGDNGAEWDGSEDVDQGSLTPNTEPFMYNFTIVSGVAAGKDGIRTRRGGLGSWFNGLFQDTADDAFLDSGISLPNSSIAGLSFQNHCVYANVLDAATERGVTKYSDAPVTPTPALARELVSLPRPTFGGAAHTGFGPGTLDPRLAAGAVSADPTKFPIPADRAGDYPFTGWTDLPMGGAMRDNNMLKWTALEWLDLLAPTNIARPAISIGKAGSNSTISFASAAGVGGRAAFYAVERSTNRRNWTPFAIVSDNDAAGTTDIAATTFATLDGAAAAGTITVTDPTAIVAGTPVYYRVIPQ